jgi:hypothetical protein
MVTDKETAAPIKRFSQANGSTRSPKKKKEEWVRTVQTPGPCRPSDWLYGAGARGHYARKRCHLRRVLNIPA